MNQHSSSKEASFPLDLSGAKGREGTTRPVVIRRFNRRVVRSYSIRGARTQSRGAARRTIARLLPLRGKGSSFWCAGGAGAGFLAALVVSVGWRRGALQRSSCCPYLRVWGLVGGATATGGRRDHGAWWTGFACAGLENALAICRWKCATE
jgi:hypothetical protein